MHRTRPQDVRRSAREWSLRTLYQIDVSGASVDDALAGTLEQLRHEFVQSVRTGSSNPVAERAALECVTSVLAIEAVGGTSFAGRDLPTWVQALFADLPRQQERLCRDAFARVAPVGMFGEERAIARRPSAFAGAGGSRLPQTVLADVSEQVSQAVRPELAASARQFVGLCRACLKSPHSAAAEIRKLREEVHAVSVERWRHAGRAVARQVVDWFDTAAYARRLVRGTEEHRSEIDLAIRAACKGWSMERLAVPDRNILRQACCELRWSADVPARVAINEAVELAKRYGSADSGRFVNGVLAALLPDENDGEPEERIEEAECPG